MLYLVKEFLLLGILHKHFLKVCTEFKLSCYVFICGRFILRTFVILRTGVLYTIKVITAVDRKKI